MKSAMGKYQEWLKICPIKMLHPNTTLNHTKAHKTVVHSWDHLRNIWNEARWKASFITLSMITLFLKVWEFEACRREKDVLCVVLCYSLFQIDPRGWCRANMLVLWFQLLHTRKRTSYVWKQSQGQLFLYNSFLAFLIVTFCPAEQFDILCFRGDGIVEWWNDGIVGGWGSRVVGW